MLRRWLYPLIALGCVLALLGVCFGSVLFRGEQFGYRDAAHFYYPLYYRVQQEWSAGRLPLWENEENAGMPLLGNPTAAVLYPGKLIFAPFGVRGYAWGARLYVVAHTLLAVAGMYALARTWGIGREGSALAALGYGFGAPVLFQYCNVIFLVGAAWVPWGLRGADRWLRLGRRSGLVELAAALAMQTLGGDPEASYLTGLAAAGYALVLTWGRRGGVEVRGDGFSVGRIRGWQVGLGTTMLVVAWVALLLVAARRVAAMQPAPVAGPAQLPGPQQRGSGVEAIPQGLIVLGVWAVAGLGLLLSVWRRWRRTGELPRWVPMLAGLAGAGAVALALTGAQLLPVLEYSSRSVRAAEEGPHDIFPFSLEPYRVVEWIWPEAFGTSFHGNRHWLLTLPPRLNHKTWVWSLYCGGLTAVLALSAAGFRNGPPWRAWLTALALVSFGASLGEFAGPLWYARWSPAWAKKLGPHDPHGMAGARNDGYPRDGAGSPYWLLATALPGFGQFRYPSKLLTFTGLGLAGLAGLGWDRVAQGRRGRALAAMLGLLLVSVAALAAWEVEAPRIRAWLEARSKGMASSFGPFDAAGAWRDTRGSMLQGAVVGAAGVALVLLARRRPRAAGVLALVATTADLAVANAGLIQTVPQSVFEGTPRVIRLIEEAERANPSDGPYRVHRTPLWNPQGWMAKGSTGRIGDFVRWERDTIQPKYALPFGLEYTLTEGVTELYDYWWFFGGFTRSVDKAMADQLKIAPGAKVVYYPRRGFDLWNTRYFVLPYAPDWLDEHRGIATFLPMAEPIYPPPKAFDGPGGAERLDRFVQEEDVRILRSKTAFPRAWVVHNARYLGRPIQSLTKDVRKAPMEEILFQNDPIWQDAGRPLYDPKEVAWIEFEDRQAVAEFLPKTPHDPSERVGPFRYSPKRVEFDVDLARPGLVVLADVYYPGWRLTIDGKPAPVYRVNRIMRGALVKAGHHKLVYTYRPTSLFNGLCLSAAGIVGLIAMAAWSFRRPRAGWAPAEEASGTE
jgi:hypothetical protein